MVHLRRSFSVVALIALWSQSGAAQISAPPIPSVLPGVSKISVPNATGVLRYCEQKGLVSNASVDAVIDSFVNKPNTQSADYLTGAAGQILGDDGKKFPIDQVPGYLQSKACDMVLEQAKTFRSAP